MTGSGSGQIVSSGMFNQATMADGGWLSMDTAPRDGSVVEIKNSYGILPTYGLHRWAEDFPGSGRKGWQSATNPHMGLGDSEHVYQWRPYAGEPSDYVDYNPSEAEWVRAARNWRPGR